MARLALALAVNGLVSGLADAAPELGVRHRLDATVASQGGTALLKDAASTKGSVSLTIRLSSNSQEIRQFTILRPVFADVVVPERASTPLVGQTKIWEEGICHQRRGYPKITLTGLIARFGSDIKPFQIVAGSRSIGKPLPADELMPATRIDSNRDEVGSFFVFRSVSKASGLNVDLKVYTIDCFIEAQQPGQPR